MNRASLVRLSTVKTQVVLRALQQQVNALMSQNAALETQLLSQQNIAQGLAELPGAITTVLNRAQAPTRRMLVDQKGLGKPPVFSGREEHFYMWTKKVENYVPGVFPNVRGALTFAADSQDVVAAATVAIGVLELGVETSAEIDGQLFVVLSALTEGESLDIVMSAGGDHGFESWRKLHGRWNPYRAGRARSLLREILSPTRAKLPELMCAIEKMEDLVRRYCGRRDAQGNAHTLTGRCDVTNTDRSPQTLPRSQKPLRIFLFFFFLLFVFSTAACQVKVGHWTPTEYTLRILCKLFFFHSSFFSSFLFY